MLLSFHKECSLSKETNLTEKLLQFTPPLWTRKLWCTLPCSTTHNFLTHAKLCQAKHNRASHCLHAAMRVVVYNSEQLKKKCMSSLITKYEWNILIHEHDGKFIFLLSHFPILHPSYELKKKKKITIIYEWSALEREKKKINK